MIERESTGCKIKRTRGPLQSSKELGRARKVISEEHLRENVRWNSTGRQELETSAGKDATYTPNEVLQSRNSEQ